MNTPKLLNELGSVLFQQGKLDSAEEIGLAMQVLDENNRLGQAGPILHEELFLQIKYHREKITHGWETPLDRIAALERQYGSTDLTVEEAVIALAKKSEKPLARDLYIKALTISEHRYGSESVEVARLLSYMAFDVSNDAVEAYELQARAVAMY